MKLITVEVKTKYLKHKYWRHVNSTQNFFLLERLEIKALFLEQLMKMFPNRLSSCMFVLEKLDQHPQWKKLDDDHCVFNKITICCLLDTLMTDLMFGYPKGALEKDISELVSKVIIKAARTPIDKTNEELKELLKLETLPNLDQLVIQK